ncbi:MAG: shikimate dehydrogenase [Omnitrophica bacterium RIFOXYB12_FULL_50_7]|nr:MAG: shikimate dehydrogenase [Omnitrophica bacterium RIFOXYB12_FULL_50_7]
MKKNRNFKLYGIFGYPLSHTLSPAMHEAAFRRLGIDANYVVLELVPAAFKKLMSRSSKISLSGFNVTVPYKETVMKYLDSVRPEARAIGAVNTVFKQGKRWVGTNTDMEGFLRALMTDGGFHPSGKKAVILGAGGAARAVVYGLAREGVREVLIADCFPKKARKIAGDMRKLFKRVVYQAVAAGTPEVKEALQKADVIINATPIGLKSQDPRVVPEDWIPQVRRAKVIPRGRATQKASHGLKFFMDLIYNPAMTPFLKSAKKKGHRTLNGLGMLLYQGARALEHWTGRKAPVDVMRQALLEALKNKKEQWMMDGGWRMAKSQVYRHPPSTLRHPR